ncbi:unnamed protein product [Symbiodinium sp. CCMP2592]|nr:unnamed protein product [Symbiodinium sp. CCMP2592]
MDPLWAKDTSVKDRLCILTGRAWMISRELQTVDLNHRFNTVVKVIHLESKHHGRGAIVDLQLDNALVTSTTIRKPKLTGEEVYLDSSACPFLIREGEVYMLAGAIFVNDVQGRRTLKMPAVQEKTASILLPTRADAIVSVAELYAGGLNGYKRAADMLPATCSIRVEYEGMSVATSLLNDPNAVLFTDRGGSPNFSVFWGEVADLRWTQAMHDSNVEILCAAPPGAAFQAGAVSVGFDDGQKAAPIWQFFLMARLTQRRAIVLEMPPAFGSHDDKTLTVDIMKWAGYVLKWEGHIDTPEMIPAYHKKFFMIFWNGADSPSAHVPFKMLPLGQRGEMACNEAIWDHMPADHLYALQLREVDYPKVTSRELLPRTLQGKPGAAVQLRVVDQSRPLPPTTTSYGTILRAPWASLQKRDTILPEPEADAMMLIGECTTPAQAMLVLGSVIAHRQEAPMEEDHLLRYLDEGLRQYKDGWLPWNVAVPYCRSTWCMVMRADDPGRSSTGTLASRLASLQANLDTLTYGYTQGRRMPLFSEEIRVEYERFFAQEPPPVQMTHRLFEAFCGYHDLLLDDDESTESVHQKIADFLLIPAERLVAVPVRCKDPSMARWIVVGEVISSSTNKALVLVDAAIPQAHWLPDPIQKSDLATTYLDAHGSFPDIVMLNGEIVDELQWPLPALNGDFFRLRWDNHSDNEWQDVDVFKQFDEIERTLPDTPQPEDNESSEGGPVTDPPLDDTQPMTDDEDRPPPGEEATPSTVEPPVRGMPFSEPMIYKRHCTQEAKDLRGLEPMPVPATANYNAIATPDMSSAVYLAFQSRVLAVGQNDDRSLQQIVLDEWGLPLGSTYFTLFGRVLASSALCACVPVGATVVVRGRLRGGTQNPVTKLRGLLAAKGVPEESLDERIREIREHVGDKGIREAYSSWDPWGKLKAACPTRLVKESEAKHRPKAKELQKDVGPDPLMTSDPWMQALQDKGSWKLECSFFQMEDGSTPQALTKISHGSVGIALVTEREAELLLQNQETMSSGELAAIVVGSSFLNAGSFDMQQVEVPCRNAQDARILVRAQMINFGAKKVTLAGESSRIKVDELEAVVLACEMVQKEIPEWDEVADAPLKFLKSRIPTLEEALFATWGRRCFAAGKPTTDARAAQTMFVMLRIKKQYKEAILKSVCEGIYFSPRSEDGAPDHTYKVVWFQDKPLAEVLVKANTEPTAMGLVRNKTGFGIRVKASEFTKLKQKWVPAWKPLANTPYDLKIQKHFDLQNMPLCCSKAEVQKFINDIKWEALVIKQLHPRTWLVGAEQQPENLFAMQVDSDSTASDLEDRIQKKLDQLHKEQQSSYAMLKEDLDGFKKEVVATNQKQEKINNELATGISSITATITAQLMQHTASITSALDGHRADIAKDLTTSQASLKDELMVEVRSQIGTMRKRIPSPTKEKEADGKKPKHGVQWTAGNNYRPADGCVFVQLPFGVDDGNTAGKSFCGANSMYNSFYPRTMMEPFGCIWHPPPWNQLQRVGEAANPGPKTGLMTVAGLNVQSLNAFLDDGRFLHAADVVFFSETAATVFVQQKATKQANMAGRHLVCSKAAARRCFSDGRQCETKGQAIGSAILSKMPMRSLRAQWTPESWQTGRVVDSFLVAPVGLIYVCAIYGFHQGHPDAELRNEDLLREVAQRASALDCPAIIVGDINMDVQALLAWQLLQDQGWQDAAIWQQARDGREPACTFKEDSRIDYVLVNPKAAVALQHFGVSEQPETDHKSVFATFDWNLLPQQASSFRMPLDASKLNLLEHELKMAYIPAALDKDLQSALKSGDSEVAWTAFARAYEGSVAYALETKAEPRPPKHFFSRGRSVFHKVPFLESPTPSARLGEFQPTGDETNILLRQRVRQVRRIATYVAQMRAMSRHENGSRPYCNADQARRQTWRAILASSGFPGSFQKWWMDVHYQEFPLGFPSAAVANVMLDVLKNDEIHWSHLARNSRAQCTRKVFHDDWKNGGHKHFSAIKPPGMPRVDSLDIPSSLQIQLCRARGKRSFVCTPVHDDLQCIHVGCRWTQGTSSAVVSKIVSGKIHLADVVGTFTSGYIQQHRPSAIPQEITEVAGQYWKSFWNTKRCSDADDVEVMEAIDFLPQLPVLDCNVDQQDLQWALSKLSTKKARGMDGFSNYELKALPLALHPHLLDLLNLFTKTGVWPQALLRARMALLHKTTEIGDITTTRPITVLASVYRLWAKIMTRKLLRHVTPHLPKTLFGSVPGRCSGDMVGAVQSRLERSLLTGQPMHGVSLDFSKAYNTLPRELLEKINHRLGLGALWKPYSSFLSDLQRHFKCGDHWGSAQLSTVGVPEGCPIAVGQMILLTWVFTEAMRRQTSTTLFSYVDDWVMLNGDAQLLAEAIMQLDKLARKFGLLLSLPKSGVFATDQKLARKLQALLGGQGFRLGLVKNFKGLGINFQTAKQLSAQIRDERWTKSKVLLNRLQYMPWSEKIKTQIVTRGIMPLVFFGAQTWATGKDFIREVRAKCNHSVWGKKQYHLHYLTPLFSGTCYEPVLYLAKYRFSALLRLMARDLPLLQEVWDLAIQKKAFFKRATKGMVSLFLNQLHDLGWELQRDGTCISLDGWVFKIWEISAAQFADIVSADWERNLLQHLHTKKHFADLQDFSVFRSSYPPLPDPLLEGFMRKVRLGGLFPQRRRSHVNTAEEQFCHHCGAVDTLEHRVHDCPATFSVRLQNDWKDICSQPDYMLLTGLFPRLKDHNKYLQALDDIQHPPVLDPPIQVERFNLFTDGSAIDNTCPFMRLCGWAVTCAHDGGPRNTTLCAGLLPGRRQTVFRAEFHAVNAAIASVPSANIYTDNQAVAKIVNQLLVSEYTDEAWIAHHDRDLIRTCSRLLSSKQRGAFSVTWVKAHRPLTSACNNYDLWLIHHNAAADSAANKPLLSIPPELLSLRTSLTATLKADLLL